jgi:hypothetical protein
MLGGMAVVMDALLTIALYLIVITAAYCAALFGLDWLLTNRLAVRRFVGAVVVVGYVLIRLALTATPVFARLLRHYASAQYRVRMDGSR